MRIPEFITSLRWSKEQNYVPPWVTLNTPETVLFLKYYAAGLTCALFLALLYSTYGNYFAVCRDAPKPKSIHFAAANNVMQGAAHHRARHFGHRRYAGYAMQRDLDWDNNVSP